MLLAFGDSTMEVKASSAPGCSVASRMRAISGGSGPDLRPQALVPRA